MADDPGAKQAAVDALKASVLKGNAEAEGMDATNPEQQRMMEGWCASNDGARADPKTNVMCDEGTLGILGTRGKVCVGKRGPPYFIVE